jgi:hypothetical protein
MLPLAEALDRAVAKTGDPRYRQLVDPAHPSYNPAYIPIVHLLAGDDLAVDSAPPQHGSIDPMDAPILPVEESLRFQREVKQCRHRGPRSGSCGCHSCALGRGNAGQVNDYDCLDCLGFIPRPSTLARALRQWYDEAAAANRHRAAATSSATIGAGGDFFIAPSRVEPRSPRPWEGTGEKRPWDYRVTAAIPHLDAPELLRQVLATLQAQTEVPWIQVWDMGSLAQHWPELNAIEAEFPNVEVHRIRSKAWRFTSEPVATAMDFAFARCQTEFLYATHVDVFLKRPDYLRYLVDRCDAQTPAVGYQMSPRTYWHSDLWKRILSHTASLYHMPTMRRLNVTWSMTASYESLGLEMRQDAWRAAAVDFVPDTEVNPGLCLLRAGVGERWLGQPDPGPGHPPSVLMLGPEPNEPYETDWLIHERSTTGHRLYNTQLANERAERLQRTLERSKQLVASWAP